MKRHGLKKLIRLAPDFESWSTTTEFSLPTDILINDLRQRADYLFAEILKSDADQFLINDVIFGFSYRLEVKAALWALSNRGQELDPLLQASLDFVLGRDEYANNNIESALDYYRQSLDIWRQTQYFERQGILLFHIGLCFCGLAGQN